MSTLFILNIQPGKNVKDFSVGAWLTEYLEYLDRRLQFLNCNLKSLTVSSKKKHRTMKKMTVRMRQMMMNMRRRVQQLSRQMSPQEVLSPSPPPLWSPRPVLLLVTLILFL